MADTGSERRRGPGCTTGAYFAACKVAAFYPEVTITFTVAAAAVAVRLLHLPRQLTSAARPEVGGAVRVATELTRVPAPSHFQPSRRTCLPVAAHSVTAAVVRHGMRSRSATTRPKAMRTSTARWGDGED
jgi:hypothetical protein